MYNNTDNLPGPVTASSPFFLIKPTRRTNFPNFILSKNSTCFGHFLYPSSGIFCCTFGIAFLPGFMAASKQGQDVPGRNAMPNVQQKIPDDG
jgi:hypothetical protein